MGLFMVTVLPAGGLSAPPDEAVVDCGRLAVAEAWGNCCMGICICGTEADKTWVTAGSSFCLIVILKSFCSIVTSPISDLLTNLINSCICLKSICFNLMGFWFKQR